MPNPLDILAPQGQAGGAAAQPMPQQGNMPPNTPPVGAANPGGIEGLKQAIAFFKQMGLSDEELVKIFTEAIVSSGQDVTEEQVAQVINTLGQTGASPEGMPAQGASPQAMPPTMPR